MLLEAEQRVATHPTARRPAHVKIGRLRHGHLVAVRVEIAEPACRARAEHDPDDLARPRTVVVEPGVHHPLLDRGRHALGATQPDIVEQRSAPDGARMGREAGPHVVPPVVEMGPERDRVAVIALCEKVAGGLGCEAGHALAEGALHPRFHGQDPLIAHELEVVRDRPLLQRGVGLGRRRGRLRRQVAIARLLESQRRVGAGELAPSDRHFLVPRERNEQDVAQEPGVLGLADPRRPGALWRLVAQPLRKALGGAVGVADHSPQFGLARTDASAEQLERFGLFLEGPHPAYPEVPRGRVREVATCLLQERRDRAELAGEPTRVTLRERGRHVERRARPDGVLPEPDRAVDGRPLLGGGVALLGAHRGVVGGIARPRLEHREVVLHAVHLGADQVQVHLLGDRPPGGVDRAEARLHRLQSGKPAGVRCRRVVGHAAHARGFLEGAPLGEERDERRVGASGRSAHRHRGRHAGTGRLGIRAAREQGDREERATDEWMHGASGEGQSKARHGPRAGQARARWLAG